MYVTERRPAIQYDGANSAAVLALLGDQFTITSEVDGVLTLHSTWGGMGGDFTLNTGDWAVARADSGGPYAFLSAADFTDQFMPIEAAP